MHLAVDVDYRAQGGAVAAGVLFGDWASDIAEGTLVRHIAAVEPYRPGRFFERELPCILALLEDLPGRPETIVIDGYAVLGPDRRDGLGAHLFRALKGAIPVIGVAKTRFRDTPAEAEVRRPGSSRPLYVTSVGVAEAAARSCVRSMHGAHRIPTLLAAVDRACRTAHPTAARPS
jgi:deoxyribonuclease V